MKNRKWPQILSLSVLALILCPIQALACACCADEGEYRISFRKPSSFERDLMKNMKFGATAKLYETAASESTDPLAPQSPAGYSLAGAFTANTWKLTFRDGGRTGTLNLPIPLKMLNYAVDTHDAPPGGTGPALYKEWRFEGRPTATGIFRGGSITPTSYFLVFQGRGNRCDNAEDFSHWRLELRSPRTTYAFYGEMLRTP